MWLCVRMSPSPRHLLSIPARVGFLNVIQWDPRKSPYLIYFFAAIYVLKLWCCPGFKCEGRQRTHVIPALARCPEISPLLTQVQSSAKESLLSPLVFHCWLVTTSVREQDPGFLLLQSWLLSWSCQGTGRYHTVSNWLCFFFLFPSKTN